MVEMSQRPHKIEANISLFFILNYQVRVKIISPYRLSCFKKDYSINLVPKGEFASNKPRYCMEDCAMERRGYYRHTEIL